MIKQWKELKETIVEMRDNNGTGTQQEVCKFLTNLMDVLEKQMQDSALDKVRAELTTEKESANYDFEDYEAEYLSDTWYVDICDNSPQDAFRYGLIRAIDIIDKYAESEE